MQKLTQPISTRVMIGSRLTESEIEGDMGNVIAAFRHLIERKNKKIKEVQSKYNEVQDLLAKQQEKNRKIEKEKQLRKRSYSSHLECFKDDRNLNLSIKDLGAKKTQFPMKQRYFTLDLQIHEPMDQNQSERQIEKCLIQQIPQPLRPIKFISPRSIQQNIKNEEWKPSKDQSFKWSLLWEKQQIIQQKDSIIQKQKHQILRLKLKCRET